MGKKQTSGDKGVSRREMLKGTAVVLASSVFPHFNPDF